MKRLNADVLIHGDNLTSVAALSFLIDKGISVVITGSNKFLCEEIFFGNKTEFSDLPENLIHSSTFKNQNFPDFEVKSFTEELERLLESKFVTYIPSSLPVKVNREKNRIRSISFTCARWEFKVKARAYLETSYTPFIPRMSNEYMLQRSSKNIPPSILRNNRGESIKGSEKKYSHILTKRSIDDIKIISELLEFNEFKLPLPFPESFGTEISRARNLSSTDEFDIENNRSVRFWNLFSFGPAEEKINLIPEKILQNSSMLIKGYEAGATANHIVRKKSSDPEIKNRDILEQIYSL